MEAMSEGHPAARYAVHTAKAVETIVWLANAKPGIDVYHVVKCAFFADKDHLNRFGRPIAGDDYDAEPTARLDAPSTACSGKTPSR